MTMKFNQVSASSIRKYKMCPKAFRLAYVEGIRPAADAAPFRMGDAWHKGLEVLAHPTDNTVDLAVLAATRIYETVPDYADATAWMVEREVIANALAAYHWYQPNAEQDYEVVATELQFDLPLVNPETGYPTPNFRRVGKIDQILRRTSTGQLFIGEHKSTSRPIDSGSTYWDRLRKDTQSKFYIVAGRDLQALKDQTATGLSREDAGAPLLSGLLHDVWRKPTIEPKKLTQADSKKFVEIGDYMGQHFAVAQLGAAINVDGVPVEMEPGKKEGTYQIRETPAMYGARLLADMTGNREVYPDAKGPEWYFARREVPFTYSELLDFQYQVWAIQKTMAEMDRTGHWYENENQCEPTGGAKCDYCSICFNNVACCDGVTVPPGFKRLNNAMTAELGVTE